MTKSLVFNETNDGDVYYVYPRLISYMDSNNVSVEELAAKARISKNTVSKIRSGRAVGEKMIDACQKAMKSMNKDFNFDTEKMPAQGCYEQKSVKYYIGNRPWQEAAEELGIERYMLEWIKAEKKVSKQFHEDRIANSEMA